jgi:hypothetical protein
MERTYSLERAVGARAGRDLERPVIRQAGVSTVAARCPFHGDISPRDSGDYCAVAGSWSGRYQRDRQPGAWHETVR